MSVYAFETRLMGLDLRSSLGDSLPPAVRLKLKHAAVSECEPIGQSRKADTAATRRLGWVKMELRMRKSIFAQHRPRPQACASTQLPGGGIGGGEAVTDNTWEFLYQMAANDTSRRLVLRLATIENG